MRDSFSRWIEKKPLYYGEIEHNRIKEAYSRIKEKISHPPAIHIIGTNAKGSTGRAIAHLAYLCGKKTGHYSSPHISRFNERIWLDGANVDDAVLDEAHERLYSMLGEEISEALSYFEYTTLLAFVIFEDCELVVLEAGLGGEFDATTVCDNRVLSIFTPIAEDHRAFLGDSIEEIAKTKLEAMSSVALLAPQPYPIVEEMARKKAEERGSRLYMASEKFLDIRERERLTKIVALKGWAEYLYDNILCALCALKILSIPYDIENLASLELFGRYYRLAENLHIDVGHNPLAARAIVSQLPEESVLIYNTLQDKDYEEVLSILSPRLKRVEIIPIEDFRALPQGRLVETIEELGLRYDIFDGRLFSHENYLVFGSFRTVEAFLKQMKNN